MNPKPYLIAAALMAAITPGVAQEQSGQGSRTEAEANRPDGSATRGQRHAAQQAGQDAEARSENRQQQATTAEDMNASSRPTATASTDPRDDQRHQGGDSTTAAEENPDATGVVIVEQYAVVPAVSPTSTYQLDQLPEAVRETIEREAPGREIADIDRELEDGQVIYEVEFRDSNINPQLLIAEDGSLYEGTGEGTSEMIRNWFAGTQVSDTPPAVQEVIRREVENGGTVTDVDIERRTGTEIYEVEIERGGRQYEIHIAENGVVVENDPLIAE